MPVQTDELRTVMSLVGAQSFQAAMNGATRSVDRYNRAAAQSNEGMGHQFDPRANRWRNQETGQFAAFAGGMGKAGMIAAGVAIAITALAAAVRAAAAAAQDAVRTWGEYEAILKDVEIQSGATTAEMEKIKQATQNDGMVQLGIRAKDAAEAYKRLASEGYSAAEMMQMMVPITEASIALGTEQEETTMVLLNTMRQFGLEAQDMTMIADALATAVAKTSMQGYEVIGFLKYAGVSAAGFNWTLGETLAVADALVDKLGNSETAGEYFRQMMSSLADPSDDMSKAFQQAGLDVRDFGKYAGSAITFLEWLQSGTWDTMLLMKAFGVRAGDAARIMNDVSIPRTKALAEATREMGESHRMALEKTKTFAGQLNVLRAGMDRLKLVAGSLIATFLGPYVQALSLAAQGAYKLFERLVEVANQNRETALSAQQLADDIAFMAEQGLRAIALLSTVVIVLIARFTEVRLALNLLWLGWMQFMNWIHSTANLRRNIQEQKAYIATLYELGKGLAAAYFEAWSWALGDKPKEVIDELMETAAKAQGLWDQKRGTKPLGGDRAEGDDAAKAATDAEAAWQKARERGMAAWDRYYGNQQKLTDDRLTELQLELAAAQKAYDLAFSYSQEVATRTGDVDKTTDAIAKVEDAWSRVLDAQKALRGYYAQAAKEYQDGLLKANEAAGRDMADAIRKQMKIGDVVQYVLGGRLGENIEERIGRLKGVRRQGDSRIVLELRGTDATMKEQVMQWLVPVLQDAGRRTPVMGN